MRRETSFIAGWLLLGLAAAACAPAGGSRGSGSDGDTDADTDTDADGDGDADGDADSDGDTDTCVVSEGELDGNQPDECTETAPLESFDPSIQWTWNGADGESYCYVTPLVANLTDDDESGTVDLCDVPDVVVVATASLPDVFDWDGHIHILNGATGEEHFSIAEPVSATVTPALGDIDGDGLIEIVTARSNGRLAAFENDGALKWTSSHTWNNSDIAAVALADLDNDGDVEIITGNMLTDHNGVYLWTASQPAGDWSATTAADLDGDGDLEVVLGHAAYHHDGSVYYVNTAIEPGFPQVANLDADPQPEVLVTNVMGITVLEHDGSIKYQDQRPTGVPASGLAWIRPATIHDFDGDEQAEYALSSETWYAVYEADASISWVAEVSDLTGIAAGTAFDFLGDGTAEAMYADEHNMFIYDEAGNTLLSIERTSATGTEYPIVADIDNDESAEIVVISNFYDGSCSPTVQVIRDVEDRWIQARRIWNQHTYHVTNVREDGTIPQFEPPSWQHLNTFRTNSQIENGAVCDPPLVE